MLKYKEVNPLNVFGLRRLDFCPPHFFKVALPNAYRNKDTADWIYENLSGRFYLGLSHTKVPDVVGIILAPIVAFELHEEATYFSLFINTLYISTFEDIF